MTNPKKLELIHALQLHENVLHAEEQAIQAKDIDTIEDVSIQKDRTLEILVQAKEVLDSEGIDVSNLQDDINRIILKQEKNTELFRALHIQDSNKKSQSELKQSPLQNRLRKAYRQ